MSKCFVILGMHRSATSLLAEAMSYVVPMPELITRHKRWNPNGHFEHQKTLNLNRRILKAAGGSWDNPPSKGAIQSVWLDFHSDIEETLHKVQQDREIWWFKDPRTCLTIPLLHTYLENPHYITVFRHPREVAKSLERRNGFSIEKGERLAKIYNNRIIDFINNTHLTYEAL